MLISRGLFSDAVSMLRAASEREPTDADLLYHLGRCYEKMGSYESALQSFEAALAIDPKDCASMTK